MNDTWVKAFQRLISSDCVLPRDGNYWQIEEPGAGNSRFEFAGGKSQAFTLDQRGADVFPFFSSALRGVKAVNDGIVISVVNDETYIVAIELKTSRDKVGEALRQIESGLLFVLWAKALMRFNGHGPGTPCKFFGVVSLKPRSQARKGCTSRSAELPKPCDSRHAGGYPCFVLENHPRVSTFNLVEKIKSAQLTCPSV